MAAIEIPTAHGPAHVHLHPGAAEPVAALILGHGAGGGITAPDLATASNAALSAGVTVALVEQPYRVAGRRSPAPAHQLDAAWIAVTQHLTGHELGGLALIAGGRSAGARVACRTAVQTGAVAVLCLAFPLHPPGRPERTRQPELDSVRVPTLVVQGARDPFGLPAPGANRTVVTVQGDHSLRSDLNAITTAVGDWVERIVADFPEGATRTGAPRAR
jgi:uncharacterized protein